MTIRNRELSQFGSFIHVENSTQEIGITTEALPYVGIGTTNPTSKLHVAGDLRITGVSTLGVTSVTNLTSQQLNISGLSTFAGITTVTGETLFSKQLNVSGISTFNNTLGIIPTSTGIAGLFSGTTSNDMVRITQLGTGNALVIEDETNPDTTRFVVNASGSVGIGTTNPTSKLQVSGGDVIIDRGSTLDTLQRSITIGGARNSVNGNFASLNFSNYDNSGAAADYNGVRLRAYTPSSGQNGGLLAIETTPSGSTTSVERIKIYGSGEVGIGSTALTGTSSQLLQVSGGSYVSGSVGIGTTNPQYKLEVIGDTNITGFISATSLYIGGALVVNADTASWATSGGNVYRSSGSVGIGSTIPAYTLDVNGTVQATRFRSTETTGTAPFVVQSQTLVANLNADLLDGKDSPSGDIVGTTDNQTLTTKTINLSFNTLTGTLAQFNTALSDDNFVSLTGSETLTNKTLTTPIITSIRTSIGNTQTVPTGIGTLISTNSVGLVTTGMIASGTITSTNISATAGITNTQLANSTISGVSLGSTLSTLFFATTYLSTSGVTTTYNGSTAVTLTVKANSDGSDPTGFPIVARDVNGSFSAGNTGTITAKDFNSTSDEKLKTNIETVQNGLETVKSLRGVTFDWKIGGQPSVGVIAQELEKVLPELVRNGDVKTVNYDGLVGILIEAIKELSLEVENLKQQLNK